MIIGFFPDFQSAGSGGIQASGAIAWQAIQEAWSSNNCGGFCLLAHGRSKLRSILGAFRVNGKNGPVLIWHLGLLKLLPFLRFRPSGVVLFLHGIEAWRAKLDWATRRLLPRVDLFLSNSDHTWERFIRVHPELSDAAHETVHLGMGDSTSSRDDSMDQSPARAALMLSRLHSSDAYKGHEEMIQVWPRVLQRHPAAQLWIAGEGGLRPRLERLVFENHVEGAVRFWGAVSERMKDDLIRRSRFLALPSKGEGFGLVYLEAMRLRRPCLVSTCDAGREVVNPPEAGLAADPDDQGALADAVCRLLAPGEDWDAMSERARVRYERYFTARHFQERLVEAVRGASSERV